MRAVIYARYSSDNQREKSIEGQLRECKEYADYNEMTVVATYIDRALSARTDDRPEFQKMITDSYKSTFDADAQKAAPVRVQWLSSFGLAIVPKEDSVCLNNSIVLYW